MNFEKLNDVSCRIDDIQNNDKILIGGSYPGTFNLAVAAGICACAEIALLAQAYLQRQGFDSKYCGGELLHRSSDEDGEPHSFISMKIPGDDYFYDPANPTPNAGAHLPKILSIEATPAQKRQFENKIHANDGKRNCAFLEAKDILTKASSYYGYGDGMSVFPSFIISKNKHPNLPAKEMSL